MKVGICSKIFFSRLVGSGIVLFWLIFMGFSIRLRGRLGEAGINPTIDRPASPMLRSVNKSAASLAERGDFSDGDAGLENVNIGDSFAESAGRKARQVVPTRVP